MELRAIVACCSVIDEISRSRCYSPMLLVLCGSLPCLHWSSMPIILLKNVFNVLWALSWANRIASPEIWGLGARGLCLHLLKVRL